MRIFKSRSSMKFKVAVIETEVKMELLYILL